MTTDTSSGLYRLRQADWPTGWLDFSHMGTLADRLDQAMKKADKKVADLVGETGLSKAAIHFILNGTTKPDTIRAVNIDKLAEALSVCRDWLLYGRGTPAGTPVRSSQSMGLDEATLIHADYWVQYQDEVAGIGRNVTPERRDDYLRRLAHIYALVQSDGGRLSPAHADQIISAAKGDGNVRGTKDRNGG